MIRVNVPGVTMMGTAGDNRWNLCTSVEVYILENMYTDAGEQSWGQRTTLKAVEGLGSYMLNEELPAMAFQQWSTPP